MAKKKETITPTTMWMGCGYRAHLMDDSTDSRLVIICPGGQEAIILPRATAKQWEADVKKGYHKSIGKLITDNGGKSIK